MHTMAHLYDLAAHVHAAWRQPYLGDPESNALAYTAHQPSPRHPQGLLEIGHMPSDQWARIQPYYDRNGTPLFAVWCSTGQNAMGLDQAAMLAMLHAQGFAAGW